MKKQTLDWKFAVVKWYESISAWMSLNYKSRLASDSGLESIFVETRRVWRVSAQHVPFCLLYDLVFPATFFPPPRQWVFFQSCTLQPTKPFFCGVTSTNYSVVTGMRNPHHFLQLHIKQTQRHRHLLMSRDSSTRTLGHAGTIRKYISTVFTVCHCWPVTAISCTHQLHCRSGPLRCQHDYPSPDRHVLCLDNDMKTVFYNPISSYNFLCSPRHRWRVERYWLGWGTEAGHDNEPRMLPFYFFLWSLTLFFGQYHVWERPGEINSARTEPETATPLLWPTRVLFAHLPSAERITERNEKTRGIQRMFAAWTWLFAGQVQVAREGGYH